MGGSIVAAVFLPQMLFNNWAEFSILVDQLPVYFKQREWLMNRNIPFYAVHTRSCILHSGSMTGG